MSPASLSTRYSSTHLRHAANGSGFRAGEVDNDRVHRMLHAQTRHHVASHHRRHAGFQMRLLLLQVSDIVLRRIAGHIDPHFPLGVADAIRRRHSAHRALVCSERRFLQHHDESAFSTARVAVGRLCPTASGGCHRTCRLR
jgi:hypothetical protein